MTWFTEMFRCIEEFLHKSSSVSRSGSGQKNLGEVMAPGSQAENFFTRPFLP